jgi:hypothetical protein
MSGVLLIPGGQSSEEITEDPVYWQHQELVPTQDQHESPTDAMTTATATDEDEVLQIVL